MQQHLLGPEETVWTRARERHDLIAVSSHLTMASNSYMLASCLLRSVNAKTKKVEIHVNACVWFCLMDHRALHIAIIKRACLWYMHKIWCIIPPLPSPVTYISYTIVVQLHETDKPWYLFCCFTSQVNSYGHGGTVSSPNHTFSWASLNKQLTSTSCTYFRF